MALYGGRLIREGECQMKTRILSFLSSDDGVTSIEYAIIAAVMALALVAVLPTLGIKVQGLYSTVSSKMP